MLSKGIEVIYDGKWPNACRGHLRITKDDIEIYTSPDYAFHSTGSCSFDSNWNSHIEAGELEWSNVSHKIAFENWLVKTFEPQEAITIREAVQDALADADVCCGGCL